MIEIFLTKNKNFIIIFKNLLFAMNKCDKFKKNMKILKDKNKIQTTLNQIYLFKDLINFKLNK